MEQYNIAGNIEQIMIGEIMDAAIRFIKATDANMSQSEYQDVLSPNLGQLINQTKLVEF